MFMILTIYRAPQRILLHSLTRKSFTMNLFNTSAFMKTTQPCAHMTNALLHSVCVCMIMHTSMRADRRKQMSANLHSSQEIVKQSDGCR